MLTQKSPRKENVAQSQGRGMLASCGDVHPNPGPKIRHQLHEESESECEEEGGTEHPVARQLEDLKKAGRKLDITLIMKLILRHHQQGEEGAKPKFHDPTEAERFLQELNRQLKERRKEKEAQRKDKQKQRKEKEAIAPADILRQRRQTVALIKEEKLQYQMKSNDAKFERRKYDVYNQEMNPLSKQDCKVPKGEVEEKIRAKFAQARVTPATEVPNYMPRVEEVMDEITITSKDLIDAMRGKNGGAAPGEDEVTYSMLRTAMANATIGKYIVDALNRVLSGEDQIPFEWGEIRIRLIHKGKGDLEDFENYRALAITCTPVYHWQSVEHSGKREDARTLQKACYHQRRCAEGLHAQGKRLHRPHRGDDEYTSQCKKVQKRCVRPPLRPKGRIRLSTA